MSRVVVIDGAAGLRDELVRALEVAGHRARAAAPGAPAASLVAELAADTLLVDVGDPAGLEALSRLRRLVPDAWIVATAGGDVTRWSAQALQRGADAFLRRPFPVAALEAALTRVGSASAQTGLCFLTQDATLLRTLEIAGAAARSDATLLVEGESGTGKELLARWIHTRSLRGSGPCVIAHCGDVRADGRDLVGEERDALARRAEHGTLLLDEPGDLSRTAQRRVLEWLDGGAAAGENTSAMRARVVATTQRALADLVADGRLDAGLALRLEVLRLRIAPLRERPGDVVLLARHFSAEIARKNGSRPPRLDEATLAALARRPWRGNVRELQNVLRRAAVLCPDRPFDLEACLPARGAAATREAQSASGDEVLDLRELERRAILRSLERSRGNRTEASRVLGISVRTLRNKIREYGLGPA